MKQKEFQLLRDAGLISSVRVVPIALAEGWCVDVLIKELLSTGSRTATLESDRSCARRRHVRRFATIDSAARFLHRLGLDSFHVDMADSISFATAGPEAAIEAGQAAPLAAGDSAPRGDARPPTKSPT